MAQHADLPTEVLQLIFQYLFITDGTKDLGLTSACFEKLITVCPLWKSIILRTTFVHTFVVGKDYRCDYRYVYHEKSDLFVCAGRSQRIGRSDHAQVEAKPVELNNRSYEEKLRILQRGRVGTPTTPLIWL